MKTLLPIIEGHHGFSVAIEVNGRHYAILASSMKDLEHIFNSVNWAKA